jgi:hypothetical protein
LSSHDEYAINPFGEVAALAAPPPAATIPIVNAESNATETSGRIGCFILHPFEGR